jgi:CRP-like cAMP-binding protein
MPDADFERIIKLSTFVDLPLNQIIQIPFEPIAHCYFVETGVVSKVTILRDGDPVEVGIVGSEGFVGLPAVLGAEQSPNEAVVQLAGSAIRIDAKHLRTAFLESAAIRGILLLYAQAMTVQVTQTAACNCRHEAQQRLARWLLMVDDKFSIRPLPLTQEYLGMMLGVRRQQVSLAAKKLQRAGLIDYRHGQIEVRDRAGLEKAACECYGTVANEFARLLRFKSAAPAAPTAASPARPATN